ncbi:OB-fold nucleic acid binding domain-containing protein, partial [Paraconexibacter sp.]|uniref:helix-hairpin-helix domain-containing protein n=1 Tax=Paraconexibacter sp. TaxID=2949640 RepID=UPI0035644714
AFVAIREHTTLDASEPLRRGNHAHVLTSPQAMARRFADHPDAVAETGRLADELRFDLTQDLGYRYPGSDDTEAERKLAAICHGLFDARYPLSDRPLRERAAARLQEELRLIAGLGLSGFFLLHHDLLELAREVALEVRVRVGGPDAPRALLPPGRGRGSSVSSIVCYLTGLSHVDPVKNELFLGRFLNEEITSLPDIDLDFPRDVRAELIPRIHERYGHDRSALVAAFPTYRSKGAIRELGKALGLPPGEIERVARGAEGWSSRNVEADITTALGAGAQERLEHGRWGWLAALAHEAYGLPRHLSQHPGGMIVATRPLVDCCPVVPAAMEGRQMAMWDKDSCADAGFLKIDLLGLGMLSAVERCVDHIAARHGETIDLSRIPFDDPETYGAIQRGETTGVFQIESRAQMASLLRTRPETLDDLTIQVAIVRPGPIQGGAVNPYIERRQRLRADPSFRVPYDHPSLEPVLRDTLGTIIFQDQVIEVAMAFAGFTPGEAEGLRRAMSRKRSEAAIRAYHDRFISGAVRTHGVDETVAERVYTMIVGFSGFGFPKAHGAAFGLLAYQSTWLRVHHAPEFLCALLDEQPMGFYPPDALIHDAQRRGIPVLPPDVNASGVTCSVVEVAGEGGPVAAVRIGLGYVVGVREAEVAAIVAAREEGGPFTSTGDLSARSGSGRPALERLAWSGACDSLLAAEVASPGHRRRAALWRLGVVTPGRSFGPGATQLALPLDAPAAPELPGLGAWESMIADYATTGLTTGAHPIGLLRPDLTARGAVTSSALGRLRHGRQVRVGGLVVARQRPGTASGIVFMLLEDEEGTVNLVVPPQIYERHRLTVRTEPLVMAEGTLERHPAAGGGINVLVRRLVPLEAPDDRPLAEIRSLAEVHDFSSLDERELARATGEQEAAGFRAVAPAVMSFAQGRRR